MRFIFLNTNLSTFIINKVKEEIFIINIYIYDVFFILNNSKILVELKNPIIKKYNIKNLAKVKIIIR